MGQERDSKKLYLGQEIFIFPDNVPWRDGGTLPRTTGQNAGFILQLVCVNRVYIVNRWTTGFPGGKTR